MSNSSTLAALPATRNPSEEALPTGSHRTDRSAGKGRRRRSVAQQRRAEQEQWNHLAYDSEEDLYVAPPRPAASRRQLRRSTRRSSLDVREVNQLNENEDDDLDIALAISLSLSEHGNSDHIATGSPDNRHVLVDMSYESLVMLENVKCVASPALVSRLMGHVYDQDGLRSLTKSGEELCPICQVEFQDKEQYMLTPCLHTFHDVCGQEWFLNHSRLCPVCKHDVADKG